MPRSLACGQGKGWTLCCLVILKQLPGLRFLLTALTLEPRRDLWGCYPAGLPLACGDEPRTAWCRLRRPGPSFETAIPGRARTALCAERRSLLRHHQVCLQRQGLTLPLPSANISTVAGHVGRRGRQDNGWRRSTGAEPNRRRTSSGRRHGLTSVWLPGTAHDRSGRHDHPVRTDGVHDNPSLCPTPTFPSVDQ